MALPLSQLPEAWRWLHATQVAIDAAQRHRQTDYGLAGRW